MVTWTITLSVPLLSYGYSASWIRDVIQEIHWEGYVKVSVNNDHDKVVVEGVKYANADHLATQIYEKVGLQAYVVNVVEVKEEEKEGEGMRATVKEGTGGILH